MQFAVPCWRPRWRWFSVSLSPKGTRVSLHRGTTRARGHGLSCTVDREVSTYRKGKHREPRGMVRDVSFDRCPCADCPRLAAAWRSSCCGRSLSRSLAPSVSFPHYSSCLHARGESRARFPAENGVHNTRFSPFRLGPAARESNVFPAVSRRFARRRRAPFSRGRLHFTYCRDEMRAQLVSRPRGKTPAARRARFEWPVPLRAFHCATRENGRGLGKSV